MITDGEKWLYLTVKNLPGLLRGITSTHKEDFYCLNCFHLIEQKINSKHIKKYVTMVIIQVNIEEQLIIYVT